MELIHGDCFQQDYAKINADIIITDMPYGTTNCRWDTPINLQDFWRLSIVSGGKCVLFAQSPFDKVLGVSNIKNLRKERLK